MKRVWFQFITAIIIVHLSLGIGFCSSTFGIDASRGSSFDISSLTLKKHGKVVTEIRMVAVPPMESVCEYAIYFSPTNVRPGLIPSDATLVRYIKTSTPLTVVLTNIPTLKEVQGERRANRSLHTYTETRCDREDRRVKLLTKRLSVPSSPTGMPLTKFISVVQKQLRDKVPSAVASPTYPTSTPTPTPTQEHEATNTPTAIPTPTTTETAEPTPTTSPTTPVIVTPTEEPTLSPTMAPEPTPDIADTNTPTPTPTFTPTLTPTSTPTPTSTSTPTLTPTLTPTPTPTLLPPSVSNFSPTAAIGSAGGVVRIFGSNFIAGANARIGGIDCVSSNVVNGSLVECVLPLRSEIRKEPILIENPDGQEATSSQEFFSLGSPVIWFSAASLNHLTQGDPISTLPDLSGNGLDAYQTALDRLPRLETTSSLGVPTVHFADEDNRADFLILPDSSLLKPAYIAIFAALSMEHNDNYNKVICRDFTGSGGWGPPYSSYELNVSHNAGYNNGLATPFMRVYSSTEGLAYQPMPLDPGTPYVLAGIHTQTTVSTRINGAELGNVGSPGPINYSQNDSAGVRTTIASRSEVSPGEHFSGDLAEILLYGAELDEDEVSTVEEYLMKSYSVH